MPVYKYLQPERLDVIRDARIRFTQPNALNDPFEMKPFFKTIFNMDTFSERIRRQMDFRPVLLEKYEQMPREVRKKFTSEQFMQLALGHMEKNKDQYDALFESSVDEMRAAMPALSEKLRALLHGHLGREVGILSLSEAPTNDLMWAHYAGDHAGFLIEFDEANDFFHCQRSEKDEFFHLRKVSYIDKRLNFESLEQLIDDENELFVSKINSWAYEKEWRMLVPLLNRVPEINDVEPVHLFSFPREAVRSVIFGCKSSVKLRNDVSAILDGDTAYSKVRKFITFIDLEHGDIATKPYS